MTTLQDAFADTAFWVALVVKQDQHHSRAQAWSLRIQGRITTTTAVLLETINTLSRPAWRAAAVALINILQRRPDVTIVTLTPDLWHRGWELFRNRMDKA